MDMSMSRAAGFPICASGEGRKRNQEMFMLMMKAGGQEAPAGFISTVI